MDKRVERTRHAIRTTLLALAASRPVEGITTTELCKQTGINRNTFYAHYRSPEDVLQEAENELLDELEKVLGRAYEEGEITLALCRHIAQNQELYRALWRCRSSRLSERAVDYVCDQSLGYWKGEGLRRHEKARLFLRFAAQGSLAVVESWLYDGCRIPPEEVSALINRFVLEGRRGTFSEQDE